MGQGHPGPFSPGLYFCSATDSLCGFGHSLSLSGPQFPHLLNEEVGLHLRGPSNSPLLGFSGPRFMVLVTRKSGSPGGCAEVHRVWGSMVTGKNRCAERVGGRGRPHVDLEGCLLPRAPALEVVGHPASQRQGPVCSLQVPLSQESLQCRTQMVLSPQGRHRAGGEGMPGSQGLGLFPPGLPGPYPHPHWGC